MFFLPYFLFMSCYWRMTAGQSPRSCHHCWLQAEGPAAPTGRRNHCSVNVWARKTCDCVCALDLQHCTVVNVHSFHSLAASLHFFLRHIKPDDFVYFSNSDLCTWEVEQDRCSVLAALTRLHQGAEQCADGVQGVAHPTLQVRHWCNAFMEQLCNNTHTYKLLMSVRTQHSQWE